MYNWNEQKNDMLLSQRGVCFQDVIEQIGKNGLIDNYPHPNIQRYPNQYIYVISIRDYIHYVPYIKDGDDIFLKNIIPSRKLNKKYKRNPI